MYTYIIVFDIFLFLIKHVPRTLNTRRISNGFNHTENEIIQKEEIYHYQEAPLETQLRNQDHDEIAYNHNSYA